MQKLKQISQHLRSKDYQGQVYTIPLSQSAQVLATIQSQKTKCFMLFTSDKNKDGKQWCPYCVNIKPYYSQYFQQVSKLKLPLYIFITGDQPTWKDPNHAFRKNKKLQVKSVPTFGYFNGNNMRNTIGGTGMLQEDQRKLVYESINQ